MTDKEYSQTVTSTEELIELRDYIMHLGAHIVRVLHNENGDMTVYYKFM